MKMDIQNAIGKKRQMEALIKAAVEDFEEHTGLFVANIAPQRLPVPELQKVLLTEIKTDVFLDPTFNFEGGRKE